MRIDDHNQCITQTAKSIRGLTIEFGFEVVRKTGKLSLLVHKHGYKQHAVKIVLDKDVVDSLADALIMAKDYLENPKITYLNRYIKCKNCGTKQNGIKDWLWKDKKYITDIVKGSGSKYYKVKKCCENPDIEFDSEDVTKSYDKI